MFPRLGDIQHQFGIGEGTLGLALIGAPLGAQVTLMLGGRLIARLGFRRTMLLGVPLLGIAEVLAAMASGPAGFFGMLIIAGLAIGAMEIVVNLEADRVEHKMDRRIMNRAHAFWSLGLFAAGVIGAGLAQLDVAIPIHLAGIAVISTCANFVLLRNYQPAPPRGLDAASGAKFVRPTKGILLLVAFTLSAMLLEGAGIDWSVIFMRDTYQTIPLVSGMALAIGALTQAVTRYFADGYVDRFGPVAVARVSVATLGVGVVCVTFSIDPYSALLGFALLGIGNSVIFPLAMSAAAQRTDRPAASNVAALAQLSFITFLVAPPLLGLVAENFGIRTSFGVAIPLIFLSWYALRSLSPRK